MWQNTIAHVDLDAFFASVHLKHNPFLKGYPVIIGADPKMGQGRGVVSTCSYEARKFGIHSAMPISTAYRLCPEGIYICSGREISFLNYHEESKQVMAILKQYSPVFQTAGIDEAYLDLSDVWKEYGDSPKAIAEHIQGRIKSELSLYVSIGIAETKSIAKIASDLNKPMGIAIISNQDIPKYLHHLPVRKIVGVGKKTEERLTQKGIRTIGDISSMTREKIFLLLGDYGLHMQKVVQGKNFRPIGFFRGERKSISSERTFGTDQNNWDIIKEKVKDITSKIVKRLQDHNLLTKTVSIKIRFEGFITYTRSYSFNVHLDDENTIYKTTLLLLKEFIHNNKKVRLIGVRVSAVRKKEGQTTLNDFFNPVN